MTAKGTSNKAGPPLVISPCPKENGQWTKHFLKKLLIKTSALSTPTDSNCCHCRKLPVTGKAGLHTAVCLNTRLTQRLEEESENLVPSDV